MQDYTNPLESGIDNIIVSFITDKFPPQTVVILFNAFEILNKLGLIDKQDKFIDLFSIESDLDSNAIIDKFTYMLSNDLLETLMEFGLRFNSNVTISDMVNVLDSLVALGETEDITLFSTVVENINASELEQTITLISLAGGMPVTRLMNIIDSVDDTIISSISERVLEHERAIGDLTVDPSSIKASMEIAIKSVRDMFKDRFVLGLHLLDKGIPPNMNFIDYIDYIKEYMDTDTEGMAVNIFSVLMISKDGHSNPYLVYKEHSDKIFNSIRDISVVDRYLSKFFTDIIPFSEKHKASLQQVNPGPVNG